MSTGSCSNDRSPSMERPCLHCGYNLRGTDVDGRCPECGHPGRESLASERIEDANPRWVMRIRQGLTVLALGVAFPVFGYLSLIGVAWTAVDFLDAPIDKWFPATRLGIELVGGVLTAVGAILAATLEPRNMVREESWNSRRATRLLAGLLLGFCVVRATRPAGGIDEVVLSIGWAMLIVLLVLSGIPLLRELAARSHDERARGATTRIRWGLCISILAHLAGSQVPWKGLRILGALGTTFFGVYLVLLLNRILRRLRARGGKDGGPLGCAFSS